MYPVPTRTRKESFHFPELAILWVIMRKQKVSQFCKPTNLFLRERPVCMNTHGIMKIIIDHFIDNSNMRRKVMYLILTLSSKELQFFTELSLYPVSLTLLFRSCFFSFHTYCNLSQSITSLVFQRLP